MLKLIFTTISFLYSINYETAQYKNYCNARFDFCIGYPKDFLKQPDPENGDGTSFISNDKKSQIWAYGRLAVEDLDKIEQEFDISTKDIRLTYRVLKVDWFIFSGIDLKGNIIYQKTVKKNITYFGSAGTNVFQTLRIAYPTDQSKKHEPYCKVISKSLQ